MKPRIRGTLEKEIEASIEPECIKKLVGRAKQLTIKNAEDVLFGMIVGFIFGRWVYKLTKK